MYRWALRKDLARTLILIALVVVISLPSLYSTNIDDLDSAHHLMDGYFFRDLIRDHPHSLHYVYQYHQQYPALGFIFWPPLFPFVLGLFSFIGGDHVLTGRTCILFFSMVFALAFYALLRRQFPSWLAFCATVSCITIPGIFWSFNQIMLELPTLAVMCVAMLAYLHLRDKVAAPTSVRRALLTALALVAVVYSKQPAYFLYLAILLDAICTPGLLRKRETWITGAAFVVFILPLVLFTLKFGHANLAQSLGSNTKLIMSEYQGTPRWSFAAWTFYPRLTGSQLNPIVLLLGSGGVLLCIASANFRKANLIWLGWFAFFYLTFSYYDNRTARHATFWWPAWIALAAACLYVIMKRNGRIAAIVLPALLLLPVPVELIHGEHKDYSDFHDQLPLVRGLFSAGEPGNILLFGPDKQTWTALIRELDNERGVHVLRGESLMATGLTLPEICRKFQISQVLIEVPADAMASQNSSDVPGLGDASKLSNMAGLEREPDTHFTRRNHDVLVLQYHYLGPKDTVMSDVPLSDWLL